MSEAAATPAATAPVEEKKHDTPVVSEKKESEAAPAAPETKTETAEPKETKAEEATNTEDEAAESKSQEKEEDEDYLSGGRRRSKRKSVIASHPPVEEKIKAPTPERVRRNPPQEKTHFLPPFRTILRFSNPKLLE